MTGDQVLLWVGVLGGVGSFLTVAWTITKEVRGRTTRRMQAEAAKASIDAEQAEASRPHVERALELGNFAEALSIQQTVINGLREHAAWQDQEISDLREERGELKARLAERDDKIRELEQRLGEAENYLTECRQIINGMRDTRDAETGQA